MTKAERFEGCIIAGAIGDAWGSGFENQSKKDDDTFYLGSKPIAKTPIWRITDDSQLTLATTEALTIDSQVIPESIANQFLKYHKQRKLTGIGASTLKALRELSFGGHWSQVGRKGEYAAGNGAAMRIAPLAFLKEITNKQIRDVCKITHDNDEAYIGARCIVIAIREILEGNWDGSTNLIELIIDQIPDTRIRDRLVEIKHMESLDAVGELGKDGYVVNSVPLAIAAANKVHEIGIEKVFSKLINIGGDTDTNCSIAGQISGALIGIRGIPQNLTDKLSALNEFDWIENVIEDLIQIKGW